MITVPLAFLLSDVGANLFARAASRRICRTREFSSFLGATNKKATRWMALLFGAPGEIRTPDRSVRSRVLYPAELRALKKQRIILLDRPDVNRSGHVCKALFVHFGVDETL